MILPPYDFALFGTAKEQTQRFKNALFQRLSNLFKEEFFADSAHRS